MTLHRIEDLRAILDSDAAPLIDSTDEGGNTLLIVAAQVTQVAVYSIISDHSLCSQNGNKKVARICLERGADPLHTNVSNISTIQLTFIFFQSRGQTATDFALEFGYHNLHSFLIKAQYIKKKAALRGNNWL